MKDSVTLTRDHPASWFSFFPYLTFFLRAFRLWRSLDLNVFLIHFLLFSGLSHHLWELVQHRWSPAWPSQRGVPRISLCWYGVPSPFPSLGGKFSLGKAFLMCSYLEHAGCGGKSLEEVSGPASLQSDSTINVESLRGNWGLIWGRNFWEGNVSNYFINCACRDLKYFRFWHFFLHKKDDLYACSQ